MLFPISVAYSTNMPVLLFSKPAVFSRNPSLGETRQLWPLGTATRRQEVNVPCNAYCTCRRIAQLLPAALSGLSLIESTYVNTNTLEQQQVTRHVFVTGNACEPVSEVRGSDLAEG